MADPESITSRKTTDAAVSSAHPESACLDVYARTSIAQLHDQERRELQQSRYELRRLSASILDARESERSRIARELHDELGQRLTAIKLDMADLGQELHGRASQERLMKILDLLDGTVAAVRRISSDLRPLMLDELGLHAALQWLAKDMSRRHGLQISLQLDHDEGVLLNDAAIAIYRMVQEALNNVVKHAQARHVTVRVIEHVDTLEVCVDDDGVGISAHDLAKRNAFGLLGMRERCFLLGGRIVLDTGPEGRGTQLCITLPRDRIDCQPTAASCQVKAP